ncbi:hypothetical protein AVEN_88121-1 [Araneus ventricosus]|uniref:Uncharacterized protein n=1 Tax=Araneus ventricosus TaxID=182803 RepID=A0A4Y2X444_ARAVE|nr:hypothetical protein AVEN_196939-1 [Araneus ventricosus]GBO42917.1 hypothetical protein AVEN_88121-1 [Araneus ventricosus]
MVSEVFFPSLRPQSGDCDAVVKFRFPKRRTVGLRTDSPEAPPCDLRLQITREICNLGTGACFWAMPRKERKNFIPKSANRGGSHSASCKLCSKYPKMQNKL